MIITAPVTDYIPASILTTERDILVRGAAGPERLGAPAYLGQLSNYPAGAYPLWNRVDAVLNRYFKSQGVGFVPLMLPLALSDTGIHIGDSSRAGAVGSGVQVITGVGFEPSIIIITAAIDVGTEVAWSIGFGKVGQNMCIYRQHDNKVAHHTTMCIYWFEAAAADAWTGYITAVGADGFSITWTKTGAPSNIGIVFLCLP